MQLEEYFDYHSPDDIQLKGYRIGIDTILGYYREGYTAEEIAAQLGVRPLEYVYASITHYLHRRAEIDGYLARLDALHEQSQRQQDTQPLSAAAQRVRERRLQHGQSAA